MKSMTVIGPLQSTAPLIPCPRYSFTDANKPNSAIGRKRITIKVTAHVANFSLIRSYLRFNAKRLTLRISRRAFNLEPAQVSRMKAALFAVGCMRLFGGGLRR